MWNVFRKELEELINRHSMENGSDTPDFILAGYLMNCLDAFDGAMKKRQSWYSQKSEIYNDFEQPESEK